MRTFASRAFLDEVRAQLAVAQHDLRRARGEHDDVGVSVAAGRLWDLEELAGRNDVLPLQRRWVSAS